MKNIFFLLLHCLIILSTQLWLTLSSKQNLDGSIQPAPYLTQNEKNSLVFENWLNELESSEWEKRWADSARFPEISDDSEIDHAEERFSPEYLRLKREFQTKHGIKSANKRNGKRVRAQFLKMVVVGYSWVGLAKACRSPEELWQKTRVAASLTVAGSAFIDYKTKRFIMSTKNKSGTSNSISSQVEVGSQSFLGYWKGKEPSIRTMPIQEHDFNCLKFTRKTSIIVICFGAAFSLIFNAPVFLYVSCALGLTRYISEPLVLAALFKKVDQLKRPLVKPGRFASFLGSPHMVLQFQTLENDKKM